MKHRSIFFRWQSSLLTAALIFTACSQTESKSQEQSKAAEAPVQSQTNTTSLASKQVDREYSSKDGTPSAGSEVQRNAYQPESAADAAAKQGKIGRAAGESSAVAKLESESATPGAYEPLAQVNVIDTKPVADMYFEHYGVNPTIDTAEEATSTFSIDVDTASYTVARSYLERGVLPERAAVRVEEFINYFDYGYAAPEEEPFSVQAEAFPSPNRKGYHVLHLGLKGKEVSTAERKPANLVFVVDVSGSMAREDRLGLVKQGLTMLVEQLDERDSIGIVVYGSSARVILEPTTAAQRSTILAAIARLHPEGSTNVEAGLDLGYEMAAKHLLKGGINRIILCSDGVANTGSIAAEEIIAKVSKYTQQGITMSAIGVGMGNYNDVLMEKLADRGNGNYAYVDGVEGAKRVLVENLTGMLQVIAKDVKLQVEFDPNKVSRYRLLGYENRGLRKEDFANDRKDAGEIGAGHSVTAIYEIKLRDSTEELSGNFGTLRVRYKAPQDDTSMLIERQLPTSIVRSSYAQTTPPTRLSMVAAAFAEKMRGSYWVRNLSWDELLKLHDGIGFELQQHKDVVELRQMIVKAAQLDTRGDLFAKDVSIAQMDFDRVPVLKGVVGSFETP